MKKIYFQVKGLVAASIRQDEGKPEHAGQRVQWFDACYEPKSGECYFTRENRTVKGASLTLGEDLLAIVKKMK